ncbi:MAG: PAS domain S-box protein [Salinivenus sp.]
MPARSRPLLSYGTLGLLSGVLFAMDAFLPARLPVEMLQVAVVLLTLFAEGRGPTLVFGGVTTAFVAGGYAVHRLQGDTGASIEALTSHGIVLLGLWTAVAVVLAYKHVRRAQHESEARAQAILDTTVDGIITIDADGIIETFNPAAEDIFGYEAEEVIGENVKVLMPPPYREEHDEYLRSYHETGRRKIIGIGREVRGRRKDGSTFPMDLAVSEVELDDRLIFTGIVRDISERRRLEKEILNISEQERRRIGQDLHDGLGQMLTGIGLLSQDVTRDLEDEGHDRADDMAEITEHIKEADQYARDLSHGLIPVDVEANGLPEALRRLSKNAERLYDVNCAFREVDTALVHDNTTATHLYRIAQEAVNNAVRHGDANGIHLILAAGDEQIRLQIRDDGTGFDVETVDDTGMGIRIMRYRARIIGGTLDISSTLGSGTVVTCTLPRTEPNGTANEPTPSASTVPSAGACPVSSG